MKIAVTWEKPLRDSERVVFSQGRLQGVRNLTLDLLRGQGWGDGIDLDLAVGDIWYGIDW